MRQKHMLKCRSKAMRLNAHKKYSKLCVLPNTVSKSRRYSRHGQPLSKVFTSRIPTTLLGIHDPRSARPCGLCGDGGDLTQRRSVVRSLLLRKHMLYLGSDDYSYIKEAEFNAYVSLLYGCTCVFGAS